LSFPAIDTGKVITFTNAWYDCKKLTSLPLLNMDKSTSFNGTWRGCLELSDFPSNSFDGCVTNSYPNAFLITNLSEQSIDGILVSIDTSGTINGSFAQSGGSVPSAIGITAKNNLISKGWTIITT